MRNRLLRKTKRNMVSKAEMRRQAKLRMKMMIANRKRTLGLLKTLTKKFNSVKMLWFTNKITKSRFMRSKRMMKKLSRTI